MRPIWQNCERKMLHFEFWHCRLRHLNIKRIHTLQSMVSGMNLDNIPSPTFLSVYERCIEEQQLRTSFLNDVERRENKYFEITHLNMFECM